MKYMKITYLLLAVVLIFLGCKNDNPQNAIIIHNYAADGGLRILNPNTPLDTFEFYNQNGDTITNETFKGDIYVTDFFFTRCPSICVPMAVQMKRIYDKYAKNDGIKLLSHSIDIKGDSIPVLKKYEQKLKVSAPKWHFVTGKRADIYEMAKQYMVHAVEDEDAPGGYDHNGFLVLVDGKGQIRGYCNGTDEAAVTQFMEDMDKLIDEK